MDEKILFIDDVYLDGEKIIFIDDVLFLDVCVSYIYRSHVYL